MMVITGGICTEQFLKELASTFRLFSPCAVDSTILTVVEYENKYPRDSNWLDKITSTHAGGAPRWAPPTTVNILCESRESHSLTFANRRLLLS